MILENLLVPPGTAQVHHDRALRRRGGEKGLNVLKSVDIHVLRSNLVHQGLRRGLRPGHFARIESQRMLVEGATSKGSSKMQNAIQEAISEEVRGRLSIFT